MSSEAMARENNSPSASRQGSQEPTEKNQDATEQDTEDVKPNLDGIAPDGEEEDNQSEAASSQTELAAEDDQQGGPATEPAVNYDALSPEELFARVDQDQLGKLQLLKRYHADARAFIRLLEDGYKEKDDQTPGAIDKIVELLNSKAKSEVLEAIDFLAVASQYRIEAAEVSLGAVNWSQHAAHISSARCESHVASSLGQRHSDH